MIVPYREKDEAVWDEFVLRSSVNGNFLQTRNFLNYHAKGRFKDASVMFLKGGELAAVLPANEIDGGEILVAHQGSTFGGIVVGKGYANTVNYNWIFKEMTEYFENKGYKTVELRMHHWLYSPDEKHHELLDYYFQLNGFAVWSEIGFYIDIGQLGENYVSHFEKLKKRKLNKARKLELSFRELKTDDEVRDFYEVLEDNMRKFNTAPVHTLEEILDLKNLRLKDIVSFYGVFLGLLWAIYAL